MNFFKYPVSLNRKCLKILAYLTLVFGTLLYTFVDSIQNGMHQALPGAVGYHTTAMSIAISELKYGLKGYQFYNKVRSALENNGMTKNQKILNKYGMTMVEIITNDEILNNAIQIALNVNKVSSAGQGTLFREDIGIVTFYKLAFKVFGYKIESLFYLYFLLLVVSISIYIIVFYKKIDLWNILLLFVCSHFIIVVAAPSAGIELFTVHNPRFIPVLAILPTLYLALLTLSKHRLTFLALVGAALQVGILMLVIHTRTGTVYQIMFLTTTFGLTALWNWKNDPKMGWHVLSKVRFWPLAILFIGFFILKMHLLLHLHNSYTDVRSRHLLWHPIYRGLGAYPDNKYGIDYTCDSCSSQVVREITYERYGSKDWSSLGGWELYESILKDEYLKILVDDPLYIINNYLYKPILFIKNYFGSTDYKASNYLFKWAILCVILIGGIMAGGIFLKLWLQYFYLLILGFAFSLLPTMIAMPMPALIADPALFFTFLIYMIISGVVCYAAQYLKLGLLNLK